MVEGREWYQTTAASPQAIEDLRAVAPSALPESYLHLLSVSNGGEGPLPVDPFSLCLDPAEEVRSRLSDRRHVLDGFLPFGGSGGGELLAFDMRNGPPWPIVTIDMVAGPTSAKVVATEFDKFIDLIGFQPSDA